MDNKTGRRIPNLLRKYRRARGLKQKEVARILNFKSQSRISRWEKGLCLPTFRNVIRLSIVYRVMVDAIFSDLYSSTKQEIRKREDEILSRHLSSNKHA
jgi:transcriptional regulator with XRE-family HTH domain